MQHLRIELSDDPVWPHIDFWADDLGLDPHAAVGRASAPLVRRAGSGSLALSVLIVRGQAS